MLCTTAMSPFALILVRNCHRVMNSRLASISNKQQEELTPLLLALGNSEKPDVAPTAALAAVTISLSWAFLTPYSEGLRYGCLVYPTEALQSCAGRHP